jgi:hypothetical protein
MKFSAYLPLPIQPHAAHAAAPARRWWLGWLQLLGAWLLCMLLCANIALVLAKGIPMEEARPTGRKPTDCVAAEGILKPVAAHGESANREASRAQRCRGA